MANRLGKFVLYAGGGIVALMILGMIISLAFSLTPEDVNSLNSVEEWMWFRVAIYSAIVVFWVPICKCLTIGKIRNKELDESQRTHLVKKREQDIAFLRTYWWKVALVFAFFEIVFIQQMGL